MFSIDWGLLSKIVYNNCGLKCRISDEQIREIKIRIRNEESLVSIHNDYDISYTYLSNVKNGKYRSNVII